MMERFLDKYCPGGTLEGLKLNLKSVWKHGIPYSEVDTASQLFLDWVGNIQARIDVGLLNDTDIESASGQKRQEFDRLRRQCKNLNPFHNPRVKARLDSYTPAELAAFELSYIAAYEESHRLRLV
jgi:hypothetical protein